MRHVTIIVRKDWNTGELGFLVKGMQVFNGAFSSVQGDLIAHDLLEHQNGISRIGSIDDELEALGGLWYVRGQFGVIRPGSYHSAEHNISADLINLGQYYCGGVEMRTPVPVTRRTDETDVFEYISDEGARMLRDEMECTEEEYPQHGKQAEFMSQVIPYMRRGYSKAKRRFGDGYKANSQFWAIARAVDRCVDEIYTEGQEFILSYGKGEATMHERVMGPYDY